MSKKIVKEFITNNPKAIWINGNKIKSINISMVDMNLQE